MATLAWNTIRQTGPSNQSVIQRRFSDAIDRLIERHPEAVERIKASAFLIALLVVTIFLPQVAVAI